MMISKLHQVITRALKNMGFKSKIDTYVLINMAAADREHSGGSMKVGKWPKFSGSSGIISDEKLHIDFDMKRHLLLQEALLSNVALDPGQDIYKFSIPQQVMYYEAPPMYYQAPYFPIIPRSFYASEAEKNGKHVRMFSKEEWINYFYQRQQGETMKEEFSFGEAMELAANGEKVMPLEDWASGYYISVDESGYLREFSREGPRGDVHLGAVRLRSKWIKVQDKQAKIKEKLADARRHCLSLRSHYHSTYQQPTLNDWEVAKVLDLLAGIELLVTEK